MSEAEIQALIDAVPDAEWDRFGPAEAYHRAVADLEPALAMLARMIAAAKRQGLNGSLSGLADEAEEILAKLRR